MLRLSRLLAGSLLLTLFATAPSSTSYTLKAYEFGSGGNTSSDGTYSLNGTSGGQTGPALSSTQYGIKPGEKSVQTASVPPAPALTNPSGAFYNKLNLVINNTGNTASDTKFLIAISSNSFTTTYYVQPDHTVSTTTTPVIGDYQTYANWGGASGVSIVALTPNTPYQVKVSALQAGFTGSAFGPATGVVNTALATITFSLATSLTATPPFAVGFNSLASGTVFSGTATILATISTNAYNGGDIYVRDASNGLFSQADNAPLTSASTDLTSAQSGYGAIVTGTTQSSGGPLASSSPYNGTGNIVGALTTTLQSVASTPGPIGAGTATITLKAKASTITNAASDYADTLTLVAGMQF